MGEQKQVDQTKPTEHEKQGNFRPVRAKRRWPARRLIVVVAVICVLLGAGALGYLWWKKDGPHEESGTNASICSDDAELTKAREATEGDYKFDELLDLSEDIKKRENYTEDANCVYIVLKAALASESVEDANSAFAQLEKFAKGEGDEPKAVAVDGQLVANETVVLDELKIEVDAVKTRSNEVKAQLEAQASRESNINNLADERAGGSEE